MTAVMPRPAARTDQLGLLGLLLVVGALVVVVLVGTAPAPATSSATDAYLAEIGRTLDVAPAYVPDVIAAGWTACGDLGRGTPADVLVGRYAKYGIGGDLYSRDGAATVVEAAQHALCP